jgi:biofilm PGA synthesis N-glycosyltransferase PgaC
MVGIFFWACIFLVIYIYIGYPFLITLIASFRKDSMNESIYLPTLTLLIAAYNEEKIITEKLENSLSLDYPRNHLQIIVADDGSTDETANIVRSFYNRGVQLISYPQRRGKLSAINNAMQKVHSEIVLFSDADNFYQLDAVREIVKPFSNSTVGAVSGGRVVLGESALGEAEGSYWKYEEFIKRQESRMGSCVGVAGDALAIRTDLYTYPPPNVINDDFYIALSILRQGYRVVYAPKARSFHPISSSAKGEIERRTRIVAGRYQSLYFAKDVLPYKNPFLIWQIISHKYLRVLIPFFMVGALLANLFVLFVPANTKFPAWIQLSHPYNWVVLYLQLLFYLTSWLGMRFRFNGLIGKILYIPTFLVNSNFAAIRGLFRFLMDRQPSTWHRVSHSGRSID